MLSWIMNLAIKHEKILHFLFVLVVMSSCSLRERSENNTIIENEKKKPVQIGAEDELNFVYSIKKDPINLNDYDEKKINRDKELIKLVNNVNEKQKGIREALMSTYSPIVSEIGNGLDFNQFKITGDYLDIYIYLINYDDKWLEYHVKYDIKDSLYYYYKDLIKAKSISDYGHSRYTKWNINHIKEYQKKHREIKWFIPEEDQNSKRDDVLEFFTYYVASDKDRMLLDVNWVKWSYWSKAMDNARYLLINKDLEGIKTLMFSQNKQGRIIGAVLLKYLEEKLKMSVPSSLRDRANGIFKEDGTKIRSGYDYSHWGEPAPLIDIREDFELFLKTK